jgi:antirepressor CarS-like protein
MGSVSQPELIKTDVRGAPFKIGTSVRVVRLADETANRAWLGRTGSVKFFSYDCGCGQTYPSDPMIGVELPSGKVEEFWKEELRPVSRRVCLGRHNASTVR